MVLFELALYIFPEASKEIEKGFAPVAKVTHGFVILPVPPPIAGTIFAILLLLIYKNYIKYYAY
jgi:hypothetical protein